MFWRIAGLSAASPLETILDKKNFTLEELLDEDEIIQECRALNARLINFLQEKTQVEQLLRYFIEEPPENAEKNRAFRLPFIACEIFTCEVDMILKTLVEDQELLSLLFSFLETKQAHNTTLAGYFSKVVICLLLQKTVPLMHFIKDHQKILNQLVDLIGVTSIMEVLKRLIGTNEHLYTSYTTAMQWIEDTDILEMVADKFSSSDSPEVHANAAEFLCAATRFAPPGLAAKISSPNFIGKLFQHALEESRPKSVLVNSLSICISLLDPNRPILGTFHGYSHLVIYEPVATANPEVVEGMLKSLGDLLKLLDVSSSKHVLATAYGMLQPPLGKHRLKIVEFVSVFLTVGREAAEKALMQLGAVKRILDLFFQYCYNNFLHHHVENIVFSCLGSKDAQFLDHLLRECDLIGRIIDAERHSTLDPNKPTVPTEGRKPPRIGNIGHVTRISNKVVQLANNNSEIQRHLQRNSQWTDWYMDVLTERNSVENVYTWACGRPTSLHAQFRDGDDYQDIDYDVAALANNLSQAFQYGTNAGDNTNEVHDTVGQIDEDVYLDDESAEVVISSLRLEDNQEGGSIYTNSNWFAFEANATANDHLMSPVASPSPDAGLIADVDERDDDNVMIGEGEDLDDTATSSPPTEAKTEDRTVKNQTDVSNATESSSGNQSPATPVEWRETMESGQWLNADEAVLSPNGEVKPERENQENYDEPSASSSNASVTIDDAKECAGSKPPSPLESHNAELSSTATSTEDAENCPSLLTAGKDDGEARLQDRIEVAM